jgi:galactokinase/CTP:molybdopterin cytidylyltransferase MocA
VPNVLPVNEYEMEHLLMDSGLLLGVLEQARHLLDWEGEAIVPEGPEEALIDYMARHHTTGNPLALALLYTFRHLYGNGAARIHRQVNRYAGAIEQFASRYGPGPVTLGRAPARINILGEHVDYVRYLPTEVLPFASREHDMLILFRPTDKPRVRGCSTLPAAEPAEFRADEGPREKRAPGASLEDYWLAYLHRVGTPRRHWINYVKASVFFCAMKYGRLRRGFDFLLDSTIPAAGGASSSSAVVVLTGAATRVANRLPFDAGSLAEDSALAEWYIGTRGGNMDHYTMCLSRRQSALHLNFSPFKTSLVPLHRFRYRWVAFFSHPADKSGDVFLKFNERSAVSRLLIPALLERLCRQDPALGERWNGVVKTLSTQTDEVAAGYEAREILSVLPESVTLTEIRRDFPSVYAELERGYPRLANEMGGRPIAIRPRALHHAGEVVRVREAVRILQEIFSSRMPEAPEKTEPGLRAVGDLITETHESLRDLYELTTPDIDELTDIILGHAGVYGARLMGGGFGGNVLALVSKEHVAELVDRVQSGYYAPRSRNGLAEGSVTVSTPGEGFGLLCLRDVLRRAVVNASAIWWKWETYAPVIEKSTCELLGIPRAAAFKLLHPIQPVIVAGGRGKLRLGGGYRSPAALNVIDGKPSIARVLDSLAAMPFKTLPPIIVVSPAMKGKLLKEIRLPRGTRVVVQQKPLGTGHAVLTAIPEIRNGETDVLVVWGSQPLLSADTLARSVVVYQALGSSSMLFPAAVTRTPYAPIQRDLHGYVVASRETAAEGAPTKRLGETNVGAFLLSARLLKGTLPGLHVEMWDETAGRYNTKSGELGFPNEMARALVRAGTPVIALPIARVEESLGLRNRSGYDEVRRIVAKRAARK